DARSASHRLNTEHWLLLLPFTLRGKNHSELTTFHFRVLLYGSKLLQVFLDTFHHIHTEFLVGHLTTAETQCHLGLVPTFQKTYQVAQLDLIVSIVRPWAKFHFFDLRLLLGLALGGELFFNFKHLFAVIHHLAHRGFGIGGDF